MTTTPVGITGSGFGVVTPLEGREAIELDQADNTSDADKPVSTATQAALDALAGGVQAKPNIQAASVVPIANLADVTLATAFTGITLVEDDRTLVRVQASDAENGWYAVGPVAGGKAPLTRTDDANSSADFIGVTTCIIAGGTLEGKQYKTAQADNFSLGTDPIVYTEVPCPPLSDATPENLGVAGSGTAEEASRSDHVHALPGVPWLIPVASYATSAVLNPLLGPVGGCVFDDADYDISGLTTEFTLELWAAVNDDAFTGTISLWDVTDDAEAAVVTATAETREIKTDGLAAQVIAGPHVYELRASIDGAGYVVVSGAVIRVTWSAGS